MSSEYSEIVIDEEFKDLLPPLTKEEFAQLEANILADGKINESLKVWSDNGDDILLDGHHRMTLAEKHSLECDIEAIPKINNRQEAKAWIIKHARGQRNLTPEQESYLRGVQYNNEKGPAHRPGKKAGHNVPLNTRDRLAEEHKVTPKTIQRDADFATAVDAIAKNAGSGAKQAILNRDAGVTKKDVIALSELPAAKQKEAIKKGPAGIKAAIAPPKPTRVPKTYPLSEEFVSWLGSIIGWSGRIQQEHGSLSKMVKSKGWQDSKTKEVSDLLSDIIKTLTTMKKEIQQHVE